MARGLELDLVEVAPNANPPVCRIMDYGKFKYEEGQKAKEARKKSTNVSVKEVKYRPKIGRGDFDTKTRNVIRFIEEGHKVKITLIYVTAMKSEWVTICGCPNANARARRCSGQPNLTEVLPKARILFRR